MKDNIEIQQEFENLVTQLEKLRRINEMTSINEESARSIIETANKMAGTLTGLTTLIESDFKSKTELINGLIENLPSSISSNTIGIVEEFKSTEDQFRADLIKEHKIQLADLANQLQSQIENEKSDREAIKKVINNEVSEYRNQINPLIGKLNELLAELDKANNKTKELKVIISNYYEQIKSINFPARFDEIDSDLANITHAIQSLQSSIGNAESNIVNLLQEIIRVQNESEVNLGLKMDQVQTEIKKTIIEGNKKQQIFTYITWGLIALSLIAIILFNSKIS